jgi:predicted nuclease with TOPRIM domain
MTSRSSSVRLKRLKKDNTTLKDEMEELKNDNTTLKDTYDVLAAKVDILLSTEKGSC